MSVFRIRPGTEADHLMVAELIYHSTNAWYRDRFGFEVFRGESQDCLVFPQTYALLPGSSLLIAETETGSQIVGSCFVHERPSHFSLGILNTHPAYFGRGSARALLEEVIRQAERAGNPIRLVSSLMNLDSFSLYSRLGFVPHITFQDMQLSVPESGMRPPAPQLPADVILRPAGVDDSARIAARESEIICISRPGDWATLLRDEQQIWRTILAEREDGSILGVLSGNVHPGSGMIGPGYAESSQVMASLLYHQLDGRRGTNPVFLIPSHQSDLVAVAYSWGARNVELHVAQCRGTWTPPSGILVPTFLPESC